MGAFEIILLAVFGLFFVAMTLDMLSKKDRQDLRDWLSQRLEKLLSGKKSKEER